nr:hypothetical protein [Tanacetum cinerariifolium]
SDDGMDQAGFGVAGLSTNVLVHREPYHHPYSLGQLYFYTDHSGWWMKVKEEAIKMIQKLQAILKFQMDLLVVKEEMADEVETQGGVFGESYLFLLFLCFRWTQEQMPSSSLTQAGQMMEWTRQVLVYQSLGQLYFHTDHSGWWMKVKEEAIKMI